MIANLVQPGHDVFAGEKVKNIESKQPVEPIRPEEEPKEISSFFQTKLPGMPVEMQPEHILLPDEGPATTPSSDPPAAATSSSSSSASTSTTSLSTTPTSSAVPLTDGKSSASSTGVTATSTIATQSDVATQRAGPLDHADAEEDRVRQELFPEAAAGRR